MLQLVLLTGCSKPPKYEFATVGNLLEQKIGTVNYKLYKAKYDSIISLKTNEDAKSPLFRSYLASKTKLKELEELMKSDPGDRAIVEPSLVGGSSPLGMLTIQVDGAMVYTGIPKQTVVLVWSPR